MYVDSVYVKHFQEVAQLISPMTTAPMSGCLSFYYQLQQGNDNIFSLYTRDGAGLYEEIWKMDKPGNGVWNLAEVEFSAPYPMEVGPPGVSRWALAALLCAGAQAWRSGDTTGHVRPFFSVRVRLPFPFFGPLCFPLTFPSSSLSSLPSSSVFLLGHLHFLPRLFLRTDREKASQSTPFLEPTSPRNLALWSW